MSAVGFFGILICVLAYPFALRRPERARVVTFAALVAAHVGTTIFYYYWQQTNTSDSPTYYYDLYGFYGTGFNLNTIFVVYLVQFLKQTIGGSFLDYFLLFQATGLWAIVFMMRTFEEIYEDVGVQQPLWTYLLLFLPSLHFWTSSIGKDGPLALGAAMAGWAALRITRRYLMFLAGLAIMLCFRPHIALVAIASLAIALILDRQTKIHIRVSLGALVLVALGIVAGSVSSTFEVDVTSAQSVSEYISLNVEIVKQFDTGTAVINASFPFRLFSLLFRPFFFDAGGALGLVASFENVLMIVIFFTFASAHRLFRDSFSRVLFFRYACVFSLTVIVLLTVVYYNVGLGLRQRTMVLPTLLTMFVALRALTDRRRAILAPHALKLRTL